MAACPKYHLSRFLLRRYTSLICPHLQRHEALLYWTSHATRFYSTDLVSKVGTKQQGRLPSSIEDVLNVANERFTNLTTGVSDVSQILEMLNQLINSIRTISKTSKNLPLQLFSDSRFVSFMNQTVMKSIRRFTPSQIISVCFMVKRIEYLGVETLREFLNQSITQLITRQDCNVKLNQSCSLFNRNLDLHLFGGLTLSEYCQLPLLLSSFHQLNILKSDQINNTIKWMDDVVSF